MMLNELDRDVRELAAQLNQVRIEVRESWAASSSIRTSARPPFLEKVLASSRVDPHQPIAWPHWPPGLWPKAVALLQKVARRLLRWYINPIVEQQNTFNAAVADSLEALQDQITLLFLQSDVARSVSGPPSDPFAGAKTRGAFERDRPLQHRLHLAFFSPLSPLRTAIADHTEGLLLPMADHADVDLYIDDGYQPNNPAIFARFAVRNHQEFAGRAGDYDAVLYAMGDNADFHGYIYEMLQRYPGVVILHDTTLHRFLLGLTVEKGNADRYLDEMEYAYGIRDLHVAARVLAGRGEVFKKRLPFVERVVDAAQGIIVHNDSAREQILKRRPGARVVRIAQHFSLPPGFPSTVDCAALRAEMGLADRFVIASFGIFVPDKRLDSCLGAFARFAEKHPRAVYLLVGSYPNYDLPDKVRRLGLEDQVLLTGWVDPIRFTELMFVSDVGVHLRYPHIGGTPFSPLRMLGLGVPTIVSDIEPLAEFPEGCCIKVPPDELEEDTLLACLELLAGRPDLRHQLGENGRRFLAAHHDARIIARQYLAFIEQTVMEWQTP